MAYRVGYKDVVIGSLLFASVLAAYQWNKPISRVTRIVDSTHGERNFERRKHLWQQAVDESRNNVFTPRIHFNLLFQLAIHQLDSFEEDDAMETLRQALASFPPDFDLHQLEPNTRRRVSVALDYLAQYHQDRKEYSKAMNYYDRALDAIATPAQVRKILSSKKDDDEVKNLPREHVESVAGTLHNLATLYADMGREEEAKSALATSERCIQAIQPPPPEKE